jgi:hypothetical protein
VGLVVVVPTVAPDPVGEGIDDVVAAGRLDVAIGEKDVGAEVVAVGRTLGVGGGVVSGVEVGVRS